MTWGAIIIMSFLTIVFGFACILVLDDTIRHNKKVKARRKKIKQTNVIAYNFTQPYTSCITHDRNRSSYYC